jgi:hypothetical protein
MKTFSLCAVIIFLLLPVTVFSRRTNSDDVKPAALLAQLEKAELTVSAHIYQGDQDQISQPIEADFYLLNQSIIEILKKSGFTPVEEGDDANGGTILKPDEAAYFEALAGVLASEDNNAEIMNLIFWNAIEKHRHSVVVPTNLVGLGQSKTVRSGNYYLFGYAPVDDQIFIWNVPVYLSGGKNQLELDQYNAEMY